MGDDNNLKQELYYMVRLTSKYDFSDKNVVEVILRLENENCILESVFGRRFKRRISDIASGNVVDSSCVICGQPATNKVICNHCMETIGGSEYAKGYPQQVELERKFNLKNNISYLLKQFRAKKDTDKKKINTDVTGKLAKIGLKEIFKVIAVVFLTFLLITQIWVLSVWRYINKFNPTEEPAISSFEPTSVSSEEDAKQQIALDFPEEAGYTLTFARMDKDFVGRFKLENGTCCEEAEEQLSDDERYDYFFTEDVYIFYISYNEKYSAKVGIAEVNSEGNILVLGVFNDGRKTDCHYKYR